MVGTNLLSRSFMLKFAWSLGWCGGRDTLLLFNSWAECHCYSSRLWPHWVHCLRPSGPLRHSRKSHLHVLNRNSLGRRCPMFRLRAILIVYTKMRKKLISMIIPPCCCHLSCANWELQPLVMLCYSLLHLDAQCGSLALPVGSEDDRMAPGSWEKNWTILLWMQSTW